MNTLLRPPIRKILVPLDPSAYARSATDYACWVARAHQAKISGLTVLDSPEIRSHTVPLQYGPLQMTEDSIREHKELARAKLKVIEKAFTERCQKDRLISSELLEEGAPIDLISEEAMFYDLMVVGLRTFFHFETRDSDGELLGSILDRGATPVLAVPKDYREIKKVLIAYDGSPASARAVRDFILLVVTMEVSVDLFLADASEVKLENNTRRLRRYLNDHEIAVGEVIRSHDDPLRDLEKGVAGKYDLVVCGLHVRRRLRDLVVGSFTHHLIKKEANALFLSH